MDEDNFSPLVASNAAEHALLRSEVSVILAALEETSGLRRAGELSRLVDVFCKRMTQHFEHEERSWSEVQELLADPAFRRWSAELCAQHRQLETRLRAVLDELWAAHAAASEPSPSVDQVLRGFFADLGAHELAERHMLERPSFEDLGERG